MKSIPTLLLESLSQNGQTILEDLDAVWAVRMDSEDPLKDYRKKFHIPKLNSKKESIYLCGNSLGLQPIAAKTYITDELEKWQTFGVEGHFTGPDPWVTYDEVCVDSMAKIVGAKPIEVVLMNTLTVNLHLMMTTFYKPTKDRCKILIEHGAFPSDIIAMSSQINLHGFDPATALITVGPRRNEELIRDEDILSAISKHEDELSLVILGGVNYYTGQVFDMKAITKYAHDRGILVGFDLAHAVGNVRLELNSWGPDFAVWCSYKYLNSGPGGIGGCFVHEKWAKADDSLNLPRLSGWWSHQKESRFLMKPQLILTSGAMGFQLSNPSILCLASLRASLELYDEVGMDAFFRKSKMLTGYLAYMLDQMENADKIRVISPSEPEKRGCQLSILIAPSGSSAKAVLEKLREEKGVIADFREPDCIRVAPNPFYNSFLDIYRFVAALDNVLTSY